MFGLSLIDTMRVYNRLKTDALGTDMYMSMFVVPSH